MRIGFQTLPIGHASPVRINSGLVRLKTGKGASFLIPFQRSDVAHTGTPKDVDHARVEMLFELILPIQGREKGIKGVSVRGQDQIFEGLLK